MDAAAFLTLAAIALALAAPVLAYVLVRGETGSRYRRLAWVTVFLALDLVIFGAFTRLTDSGLGCPDWPGCYGHSNPHSAGSHIRAAETAMPTGPVTWAKAWIEMIHRYLAMTVGVLIIALTVLAWRRGRGRAVPTAALIAVCVQGAFGAFTVTMKLQPIIVTLHLLGGLTVLGILLWLALRERPPAAVAERGRKLVPLLWVASGLIVVQIALGGWVSSNYAVLACPDFPLCHGQFFPPMDFRHGFTLWRALGETGAGELVPFAALVAIHWVHRHAAYVVLAVLAWLAWRASKVPGLRGWARTFALLLAAQFFTGLSNVVLAWPLPLALAHSAGAAGLAMMLVVLHFRLRF